MSTGREFGIPGGFGAVRSPSITTRRNGAKNAHFFWFTGLLETLCWLKRCSYVVVGIGVRAPDVPTRVRVRVHGLQLDCTRSRRAQHAHAARAHAQHARAARPPRESVAASRARRAQRRFGRDGA